MTKKLIYYFGGNRADGSAKMSALLGGKGANLAEMVNLKLPVPPGFTITTEVCSYYYAHGKSFPRELTKQLGDALKKVEKEAGAKFGDRYNPLLISVRSGARDSMPGMMDTILNLGLNDDTVKGIIEKTKNERFAYDSYRRFVQMYGDIVLNLRPTTKDEHDPFEVILEKKKKKRGVLSDTELTAQDLKELVAEFKAEIFSTLGKTFPEDPVEQLWGAIKAVIGSWMNERAIVYRKLNNIPEAWGTAINVQSMVFGNMGESSGTGVAFTRDPASGDNVFYGEYLVNAQGEDIVAGTKTPMAIAKLKGKNHKIYTQLEAIRKRLEKHYKDMIDIEFTIQENKLYVLQCRVGKRTGLAAVKIAVDMVREKLISEKEALLRIEPEQLNQFLRPIFDSKEKGDAIKAGRLLAKGLNAGPGAATGKIYFNTIDAEAAAARDEKVILVRTETSPEDIKGMHASEGILTARGGITSHAALVARQMGKVCVAGCSALAINHLLKTVDIETPRGHMVLKEGDWLSIDGTTGEVIEGKIQTKASEIIQVLLEKSLDVRDAKGYAVYDKIMKWSDKYRRLEIRTNADQPDQCNNAVAFGAEGIGLCRTEHMFFGCDRIDVVRAMMLASNAEERQTALAKLFPFQRDDFVEIFRVMNKKNVTIRTLDMPLHEFLPHGEVELHELAKKLNKTFDELKNKVESLHEFNPMMGHRGCRLGIIYPEITAMQARAIFSAVALVKKEGVNVFPEIMIPLIGTRRELEHQVKVVHEVATQVMKDEKSKFKYLVGTMIEVPRAAITADEIAGVADFFSFGTNDLTQMTFGISRDDAEKFLPHYVRYEILPYDPFVSIDSGVGELMKIAVERGRGVKPQLKIGICGEHGGDPFTIHFCHQIGMDYVSCSPFRVPIARFAAAQVAIQTTLSGKNKATGKKSSKKKAIKNKKK